MAIHFARVNVCELKTIWKLSRLEPLYIKHVNFHTRGIVHDDVINYLLAKY